MSGYDIKNRNSSLNLMSGRLGLFGGPKPVPEAGDNIAEESDLHGINHQEMLLKYGGGFPQQDRMILDKKRSLDRALKYSYQAATIKKVIEEAVPWSTLNDQQKPQIRALINPNKLKQDYDDKVISVPKEEGFKCGDVFEWEGTNTYWLIYLQDLTELAYFRGDIRRCNYKIRWQMPDGHIAESMAATRGPVETKINFLQKSNISLETPNYSLSILLPKTNEALEYFRRYSRFYLRAAAPDAPDAPDAYTTCWRVEATDWISTPGILEVIAVEYYASPDEDLIDMGIADAISLEPKDPNHAGVNGLIRGETFIKPQMEYSYKFDGLGGNRWVIDTDKYPVHFEVNPKDDREVKLVWKKFTSGQFEISYAGVTKTIVVESLF